jgi:hypothetical protein
MVKLPTAYTTQFGLKTTALLTDNATGVPCIAGAALALPPAAVARVWLSVTQGLLEPQRAL